MSNSARIEEEKKEAPEGNRVKKKKQSEKEELEKDRRMRNS